MATRELNAFLLCVSVATLRLAQSSHVLHASNALNNLSKTGHRSAPWPLVYNRDSDADDSPPFLAVDDRWSVINGGQLMKVDAGDDRSSLTGEDDTQWVEMDAGDAGRSVTGEDFGRWVQKDAGDGRRSATDEAYVRWVQMNTDEDKWPAKTGSSRQWLLANTENERRLALSDDIPYGLHRARRHAGDAQSKADEQDSFNNLSHDLYVAQNETSGAELQRDGKLFFSLVQILPVRCATQDNITRSGVCLSSAECSARTGVASGSCAQGLAVCCILQKTCLQSTNINNTFFVNPNYPAADVGAGACSLTINRANSDICQMRVDFLQLELSQPDANGQCITDFLTVTGGITDAPIICGSNTGQHMYIDVDPNGGSVRLSVDRTAASVGDRVWNVRVAQIPCTSSFRAPRGCLQYFTETSGTVQSFNFNQMIDEEAVPLATRQVSSMDYSACVQMAEGYCSIMWSRNITGGEFGFTVSHAVDGVDPEIIGTPSASTRGVNCTTDYVVIPGGVDDTGLSADRFCGYGFPNSVTSSMKPFLLYVRTDDDEQPDTLNRGFSLDYRQTIC